MIEKHVITAVLMMTLHFVNYVARLPVMPQALQAIITITVVSKQVKVYSLLYEDDIYV